MTESAKKLKEKSNSEPNIGLFLCKCGKNIGGTVDIDQLAKEFENHPNVKLVQVNNYTCSDPGQVEIETAIEEQGIEKIVVAACSPRLHGPTWKTLLRRMEINSEGIDRYGNCQS